VEQRRVSKGSDTIDSYPIDSTVQIAVGRWHPPGPCWARRCDGGSVVSSWPLAFCLRRYPPSDAEHHVLELQDPDVQHGQTEIKRWRKMSPMADKPDRRSTSALEIWAHQRISTICCWHLMWKACSVFISAAKRVHVSAQWQTIPVLGTGVLWCWYWQSCISTTSAENSSLSRQAQYYVAHPVGSSL